MFFKSIKLKTLKKYWEKKSLNLALLLLNTQNNCLGTVFTFHINQKGLHNPGLGGAGAF